MAKYNFYFKLTGMSPVEYREQASQLAAYIFSLTFGVQYTLQKEASVVFFNNKCIDIKGALKFNGIKLFKRKATKRR